jgi:hypothetical protein
MNEAAHYTPGFKSNLELTPQVKNSRLMQCVDADLSYTDVGKMFNADNLDVDDPVDVVGRVPNSPEGFADHTRRVGFFSAFHDGRFIENLEKVRMLQDPANTVMSGMMAKKWKKHDQKIIAILDGSSYNGENGTDVVAFPAGQIIQANDRNFLHAAEASVVAGSGNLPLTVGKLIYAGVKLDEAEIDTDDGGTGGQRFFAWSARQKGALLASTPATSSDYNTVKALVNGQINEAFGFTFVRTELLPKAASVRRCYAFVKKAVQFKVRPIQNAWIDRRKDKSGRWYAYYETEHGGLRRYDTGVVAVDCAEA